MPQQSKLFGPFEAREDVARSPAEDSEVSVIMTDELVIQLWLENVHWVWGKMRLLFLTDRSRLTTTRAANPEVQIYCTIMLQCSVRYHRIVV